MSTKIFLDAEFSSLLDPYVWSVGLVTLDGERECYVELDPDSEVGHERMALTPWDVREGVLDKLGIVPDSACESEWAMGRRVGDWLLGVAESSPDGRVELMYDYSVDLELLVSILEESNTWQAVRIVASEHNIATHTGSIETQLTREACYLALRRRTPPLYRHHALGDAYALREAWRTWNLVKYRALDFRQLLLVAGTWREGWLYEWLATPAPALSGRTPLDALDQADGLQAAVDALVEVMERIEGTSR